jgi:pSer/pThr/pTyr-binding forkhead associated (FHA) protein
LTFSGKIGTLFLIYCHFLEESMPEYQIVMRAGPTPGKVFPVSGESFTIGREPGNGIVINDAEISRKHARMAQQGNTYTIEDLGSTNGTFVNGVRLTAPHALRPGEVIALGEQISVVFEAVVVSDPNATMMHVAKPSAPEPAPVSQPISQPIPSLAGQVPAGPEPVTPAPPKKRSGGMMLIIVLLIVFLCIFCLCLGFFWWVDSGSRWCQLLPFIVPLFGGSCP